MKELLANYNIQEILVFVVMLAIAFKSVITFWDWLIDWVNRKFNKSYGKKAEAEQLQSTVNQISEITAKQQEQIDELYKSLQYLIDSDKDNIKSWIVEKHHKYCYEVGSVDYYILESIERRYDHYKQEGGNSYIDTLMEELRALPKTNIREEKKER